METEQELPATWTKDATLFGAVYREHAPRIRAFLCQVVGSRQAAEDVTQEMFTQLWQRPSGFDSSRGRIGAYLFGVATRRGAEWWRRAHPEHPLAADSAAASHLERQALITDALQRLTEEHRMILWLREVEGQSYAELADILHIPVGTVRSRLSAARLALRTVWTGNTSKGGSHELH